MQMTGRVVQDVYKTLQASWALEMMPMLLSEK
jgi:hypothetical protein